MWRELSRVLQPNTKYLFFAAFASVGTKLWLIAIAICRCYFFFPGVVFFFGGAMLAGAAEGAEAAQ